MTKFAHDCGPKKVAEVTPRAVQNNRLTGLLTATDGCDLRNMNMVELLLYDISDANGPTVTVRPIPKKGKTASLPDQSFESVQSYASRRMPGFAEDGLDIARTVAPVGKQPTQTPVQVDRPQPSRPRDDQRSYVEQAYNTLNQTCVNDIVVQIVITPVGTVDTWSSADKTHKNNRQRGTDSHSSTNQAPDTLVAVGINVAGRQTHPKSNVTSEVNKIVNKIKPSVRNKNIEVLDRKPARLARRLVTPDPRPEPTGMFTVSAYITHGWLKILHSFGGRLLGKPANIVTRTDNLNELVGGTIDP